MGIKGATKPAEITFPEWTEDQLKLWEEKDEKSLVDWRQAKEKQWEEGSLKEKYPSREELDSWMEKQCTTAKNKSLWKHPQELRVSGRPTSRRARRGPLPRAAAVALSLHLLRPRRGQEMLA